MAIFLGVLVFLLSFNPVFAHEAYVLDKLQFNQGLLQYTKHPLSALFNNGNFLTFIIIVAIVLIYYILVILWSSTNWAGYLDKLIKKTAIIGSLILRIALAASFFESAQNNSFLGPELSLEVLPGGGIIRFLLYGFSAAILVGSFTEFAAFIALLIFLYVFFHFGIYMVTYAHYFGILTILTLFGSQAFSLDIFLFGKRLMIKKLGRLKQFEIPFIRTFYGISLIYTGYTIKFLHQNLTETVYNQYNLQNFFHAPSNFIAAGAGLAEVLIGIFIVFGFAMRFTVLISLALFTLSALYFREMVWPHYMLYGISLFLLINSADKFTIDHYISDWIRKKFKS